MEQKRYRDLSLIETPLGHLAIACDSSAGIGNKPSDLVKCDPALTAACCVRVPLMELLCIGATPIAVIDTSGNEKIPTTERMIVGIEEELQKADLPDMIINGSSEDNMKTNMTSIGVTVVGKYEKCLWKVAERIAPGDRLFCLGQPLVGNEVLSAVHQLPSYEEVKCLFQKEEVRQLLPVGSKGIAYEANLIAAESDVKISWQTSIDLKKSCGPATVILAVVKGKEINDDLLQKFSLTELGTFEEKEK